MFPKIWAFFMDPEEFSRVMASVLPKLPSFKQLAWVVAAIAAWFVHSGILIPSAGDTGWYGGIVASFVALMNAMGDQNRSPEEIQRLLQDMLNSGKVTLPNQNP